MAGPLEVYVPNPANRPSDDPLRQERPQDSGPSSWLTPSANATEKPRVDLGRIKRNAKRMADQGAAEHEIDDYVKTEGATFEQLTAFKGFGETGERQLTPDVLSDVGRRAAPHPGFPYMPFSQRAPNQAGADLSFADSLSIGAFTPVTAGLTAAGKTIGKALTGTVPDPVGDYRHERDVQDELIRRHRSASPVLFKVPVPLIGDVPVSQTSAKELALSLPFMGVRATGQAVDAAGQAVAPLARTLLQRFVTDPAKIGAGYGAVYGANSARGGVGEHAESVATNAAGGAILGPVLHNGLNLVGGGANVLGRAWRGATGRSPANVAENARVANEMVDAGVTPFGPAIANTGVSGFAARGLANSMGGGRLRAEAGRTIGDIETGARNMLAQHTEGMPVSDLGQSMQAQLRGSLAEHSIPSNQVNRLPDANIEGITGRMGEAGFAAPPPRIDPIKPRPVAPVRPEPVNPDQVAFDMVQPRPVQRPDVKPEYPPYGSGRPKPETTTAAQQIERELVGAEAAQSTAYRQFEGAAQSMGKSAEQLWREVAQAPQLHMPETRAAFEALLAANRVVEPLQAQHAALKRQLAMEANQAWRANVQQAHARATADAESVYIRDSSAAAREASAATQSNRQKAIREAEMAAQERATAETARLNSEAAAEAQAATERARAKAMADYHARTPENGFSPGHSRESYPTEFSAAYEAGARVTPDYRMNPMGGPTAEGRAAKTATREIVDDLAREAHRRLHLNGKPFDENGVITPEFEAYLKGHLGQEIGHRISELTRTRPGHDALTPQGLKGLRSEIRQAAERAEHPQYPEMPRTSEAAALRRLHGALTEDMTTFAKGSGGPARTFTTETMAGEHVGPTATRLGNLPPSDVTVYMKPEHLERLTGGRMPPNDTRGHLPATRTYEVDGNAIMVRRNDTGAADRATRVPFSSRPEVGLRPVQMWRDSNGVHYGAPITSRAQSPGEHAAAINAAIDRSYARHLEETREPLRKLFGDRVDPMEAMTRIGKAAQDGNLSMLRPFMRVMAEKHDPTRAFAAIVTHQTNDARTLADFVTGYRGIAQESLDLMASTSAPAAALRAQLDRLANIAERMQPYAKAIEKTSQGSVRVEHIPVVGAVAGAVAMGHVVPLLTAYGGATLMSRFMASPRYVRWLADAGAIKTPAALEAHIARLAFITGRDTEYGRDIRKVANRAASATLGIKPANAIFVGEGAAGADAAALEAAKAALAEGKAPNEIWRQHGWMQMPDGKWRSEIDDSGAKLTSDALKLVGTKSAHGTTEFIASDLLQHDALFSAYPDVADTMIVFNPKMKHSAEYDNERDVVYVSPHGAHSPAHFRLSLLHELQHVVAVREGFAYGAPARGMKGYWQRPGEAEAFNTEARADIPGDVRRLRAPDDTMPKQNQPVAWKGALPLALPAGMMKLGGPKEQQDGAFPLTAPGSPSMGGKLPTQEEIDDVWARSPTDITAERIDELVRKSGGALVAPWDRDAPGKRSRGLLTIDPPPERLRSGPGTGGLLGTK